MSISFKCLICDKEFSNKFNLTKHNNKIKPCKSANVPIIPNIPTTPPAIQETNEINDLKNEVSFLRQEISEIKQLLISFINPSSQPIQPVEPIQPVNNPIEPVEPANNQVEPVKQIKQTKKIKKTKPIIKIIDDPINNIIANDEDDNIYNKLNEDFKNRSCIIQQLETEILKNSKYFKNIQVEKLNEKIDEYETQTITVLNDINEFIKEIYKNKKSIKYVDKMTHYIEIYKPVLNTNLKSFIFNNDELFFKIGDKWEYEDETINLLRETLQETIKKVVFNTERNEDINDNITEFIYDLNRTYGDEKTNIQVNNLLRELFVC